MHWLQEVGNRTQRSCVDHDLLTEREALSRLVEHPARDLDPLASDADGGQPCAPSGLPVDLHPLAVQRVEGVVDASLCYTGIVSVTC